MSRTAKTTHRFEEILIDDRQEAENVLDMLRNVYDDYQLVTVADFYDLVGITSEYTDEKWGWDDIRSFAVRRMPGGGYIIDTPRPEPIN